MKRISLLILSLLFFATAFQSDKLLTSGWVQQTIPRQDLPVKDLQFVDTLSGFLIQSRVNPDSSFISRTTDGGNNWSVTQLPNVYLTSMQFINNTTGFCAGRDSMPINALIMKTTNRGINWFKHSIIGNIGRLVDVVFVNNDTGWVCGDELLFGGVFRTTNGGISWQMQMNYVPSPSKVFFVNNTTGWVIGSANSGLYKTTNCGTNWMLQSVISDLSDVFFASADTGWVVSNGLKKSINGGNSWVNTGINPPPAESKLFFLNSKLGWVGSGPNKIFATKDGLNWGTQLSPIFGSNNVSFVDSIHGWASSSGLVHTDDGGGPITYIGIEQNGNFIPSFELGQNYPNPFNASTRIKFSILKSCYLDLKIFNIKGQEVANLISGLGYKPGEYDFYFDAGKYSLSSGVYFYHMKGATTDNKEIFLDTKKMLMIK